MMEAERQKVIIIWSIYQGIFVSFGNIFADYLTEARLT